MSEVDNIPGLKIEANGDGTITLEQEWSGNVDRVAVHAVHVRHLAEYLGLIRNVSAPDADSVRTVGELLRENARLKRNMLRLREHALVLQRDFAEHADWKHADLLEPMNQINGVVSLLDMAVDDFEGDYTAHPPAVASGEEMAKAGHTTSRQVTPADPSPKPSAKASAQLEIDA